MVSGRWTLEEDQKLIQAVFEFGTHRWKEVVEKVQTRDAGKCKERWNRRIKPKLKTALWHPQEDKILEDWVEKYGDTVWEGVEQILPNKSAHQAIGRWYSLKASPSAKDPLQSQYEQGGTFLADYGLGVPLGNINSQSQMNSQVSRRASTGEHKRKKWTKAEEVKLVELVSKLGMGNWEKIAEEMPFKSAIQCSNKWKKSYSDKNDRLEEVREQIKDIELINYFQKTEEKEPGKGKTVLQEQKTNIIKETLNEEQSFKKSKSKSKKKDKGSNKKVEKSKTIKETEQEIDKENIPYVETMEEYYQRRMREYRLEKAKQIKANLLAKRKTVSKSKNRKWQCSEDKLLVQLFERYGDQWIYFQTFFDDRSSEQLERRFYYLLKKWRFIFELTLRNQMFKEKGIPKRAIPTIPESYYNFDYTADDPTDPDLISYLPFLIQSLSAYAQTIPNEVKLQMDDFKALIQQELQNEYKHSQLETIDIQSENSQSSDFEPLNGESELNQAINHRISI